MAQEKVVRGTTLSPAASVRPTDLSKLLTLVGVMAAMAGLYFGRRVAIPLALATVLAFLLTPVIQVFEKLRFGRILAVVTVFLLTVALLSALGWKVAVQLIEITEQMPAYKQNLQDKLHTLRAPREGGFSKAVAALNDLSKELTAPETTTRKYSKNAEKQPITVQVASPPRNMTEYLRDMVGPLTDVLETASIVVIFTLFILIKREDLRNRIVRLAGLRQVNQVTQAMDEASRRLSRYLLLQFAVNAGYGLLFGLGVYAIGVPHALLWGIFSFLLRHIPYVGNPVATAFPVAMALAVFPEWGHAGLVVALFLVLELTVANAIEPWLYGSHTGVSSFAIVLAAIFWGLLWGPVGLILSTPLTVCLILLGRYFPQLSFLDILLTDEPVLSPAAHVYQRLLSFDADEPREIAAKFMQSHPLRSLYDSVLVPALSLAEFDRHTNILDDAQIKFILQSTREMVEEYGDELSEPPPDIDVERGLRITCLPARDEADELVNAMASQLLRRAGHSVRTVPINTVSKMLEQVGEEFADMVLVSALPPFAAGQARSLCRQLRQRYPEMRIALGLWHYEGGTAKAQEKIGPKCADYIATSLEQFISLTSEALRILTVPAPQFAGSTSGEQSADSDS